MSTIYLCMVRTWYVSIEVLLLLDLMCSLIVYFYSCVGLVKCLHWYILRSACHYIGSSSADYSWCSTLFGARESLNIV